ncbi:iron complex transport system permease protein [Actinoplanes campanulatus]|uniref:Iron complex transport system permease protein n=1 Tax=Actinoplanes campanulatus TaxID=113559 RepID=A0A7W5AQC4_9ACTN|nr:iron chelate uptake ABC transporter family permease subunit [Actinoplanes campanulatus]MBB3100282.1 iron complex transport system permease protein [Actinoplanes campanulatus]GGN44081.1 iron-enterobactin transporter permease [Actinoplanes campanulatus]GID40916.1 iron-enterobactin transporter permease [Actinoplanes campanulatus]
MDFGRRVLVLRHRRISVRLERRSVVVCAVLALAAAGMAVLALMTGSYQLSPGQVVSALTGGETGLVHDIVVEWRLPRVAAALVFGAALGVSGAVFQSMLRNPLADPGIIGFSQGSYTGALIVILVVNGTYMQLVGGALLGGMATAVAVYVLAHRGGVQGFRLIVVGIGLSAMLDSLNTWLILQADLEVAMAAAAWGAGSLNGVSWDQVVLGGACITVLLLLAGMLSRPMRQLELGDDAAASQGVRASPVRLGLIVVGVALTATVTAASGPIAFISLLAPQIARRLTRTAGITLAPAAFVGALLCLAADYIAQHIAPTPLPVGIITIMLGGGYLGWLLFTEARK